MRVPNPFTSLRMIYYKSTALVLSSNAIFYARYSCVRASLSPLLMKICGLNMLHVGLAYLAFGVAICFRLLRRGQAQGVRLSQDRASPWLHHQQSLWRQTG